MIFPIGDDNVKGGAKPLFTYLFLVINILIFVYSISVGSSDFLNLYGANPCMLMQGDNLWSILSSMFLHSGLMHLLGNMLFLWIFADNIESTIGNLPFLLFYFIGGAISVIMHISLAHSQECTVLVGASGAIAAVMGAYLVMFPKSKIKMTFFFIQSFYLPAFVFLGFWIAQQVYSVMQPSDSNVAFWAHIGGFIFGVMLGLFFRNVYPKITYSFQGYVTEKKTANRYNNRL